MIARGLARLQLTRGEVTHKSIEDQDARSSKWCAGVRLVVSRTSEKLWSFLCYEDQRRWDLCWLSGL
jgi:hypothetical protein